MASIVGNVVAAAPAVQARIASNKNASRTMITMRPVAVKGSVNLSSVGAMRSAGSLSLKASTSRACSAAAARTFTVQASRFDHSERTYIMIKPDGVQRNLVGEIISRFEKKGFVMKGLKVFHCPRDLAEEHYKDLNAKPFFKDLVDYIVSGPVVCMVWQGHGVVKAGRKLIGATNPLESEPGTIRGDFAVEVGRNVIHGSDSAENGEREIGLWFKSGEGMIDWEPTILPWVRE